MKIIIFFLLVFVSGRAEERSWFLKEEVISPSFEHYDCHGSSLVETSPGHLCAVWKGGFGEGKCNVDHKTGVGIWLSLFDGNEWTAPEEIVSAENSLCWTPVLCQLTEQNLLLFYRMGPSPRNAVSFFKRSFDGGKQWSEAEVLPAGIVGPTKSKPIVLNETTIISPSSVEVGEPDDQDKATSCWIEISQDGGRSWQAYGPLEISSRKFGPIEPALFFTSEGNLAFLCRDRANRIGEIGYIWSAFSKDLGKTWSALSPIILPNPDAGISLVDMGRGELFLAYNHSHTERFPLNCAISLDGEGKTWSQPLVLEKESGEFPSSILSSEGFIHLLYAWAPPGYAQRKIKHVIIDPQQVKIDEKFE